MNKVEKELIKIIKKMNGSVICFGVYDEKILDIIKNNKAILNCDIYTLKDVNILSSEKSGRNKNFNINKLTKRYKKKNNNYIIGNIQELHRYKKTFVRDSVYINEDEIFLFSEDDYDFEDIIRMYKRYNAQIDLIKLDNGVILKINVKNIKVSKLKCKWYSFIDSIISIYNAIGDLLN